VVVLREYIDLLGRNNFERWFDQLDDVTQARIFVSLTRLELGNWSSTKSIGAGVHEIRLDFGPGYRIYFGKDGEKLVILLAGGTKKRQRADIAAAKLLWNEYKTRKREA
jgi:putative addiction module killer protein